VPRGDGRLSHDLDPKRPGPRDRPWIQRGTVGHRALNTLTGTRARVGAAGLAETPCRCPGASGPADAGGGLTFAASPGVTGALLPS